jgi:3-dehydroquinate synthase
MARLSPSAFRWTRAIPSWQADGDDRRVIDLLTRLGLPVFHPVLKGADSFGKYRLLRGLRDFREHLGGDLTITLLAGLGQGVEVHEMDERLILQAITWLEVVAG